ncbi:phosphotransferase [Maribacter sp. Asnod1-A12]|uniref:phosphotransferase n=1 Tax=Maribacter sp. Asnod1-A12 TaxID=3160576 RepID=UPI00386CD5DC
MQLTTDINIELLSAFLRKEGILSAEEKVKATEKPGEGNMNVVLRIRTNMRTFIAKQSRPFVQKYQDIPAPINRIAVEHQFYETIEKKAIDQHLPKVLGFLPKDHLLFLEDLGESEDFSFVYEKRNISKSHLEQLTTIAMGIHESAVSSAYPENLELRKLNHQHIFVLPFLEENGFSLDQVQVGLQALSLPLKQDILLKEKISALGELYLSTGGVLLHGDYYPGSWMGLKDQVFVLDPEFSFLGVAEFDLGVMAAHLFMATGNTKILEEIVESYTAPINVKLMQEFAGVEVIRRLIGLAQIPLSRTLEEKKELLHLAKSWVLNA